MLKVQKKSSSSLKNVLISEDDNVYISIEEYYLNTDEGAGFLHKMTMGFRNDEGLKFTASDAEIICSVSLQANQQFNQAVVDLAKEYQAKLGQELGEYCESGNAELGIAPDPWKAKKFKKLKENLPVKPVRAPLTVHIEESDEKDSAVSADELSLTSDVTPAVQPATPAPEKKKSKISFQTADAYEYLGWFTSIRLFIARLHRITTLAGKTSVTLALITTYGGLSYGLELAVDFGVILKSIFKPTRQQFEHNPHWYSRAWNTFQKDERPMRMANAAAWLIVNAVCLVVTGGASAIINVALFGFDFLVDAYKAVRDHYRYQRALDKLDQQIALEQEKVKSLNQEIKNLQKQIEQKEGELHKHAHLLVAAKKNSTLSRKDQKLLAEINELRDLKTTKLNALKSSEVEKFQVIRAQVRAQQQATNKLRLYLLAVTTGILVGMVCWFFPPVTVVVLGGLASTLFPSAAAAVWTAMCVVGAKMIAATMAFMGSIFAGLGRRIYRKVSPYFAKSGKPVTTPADVDDRLEVAALTSPRAKDQELVDKPLMKKRRDSTGEVYHLLPSTDEKFEQDEKPVKSKTSVFTFESVAPAQDTNTLSAPVVRDRSRTGSQPNLFKTDWWTHNEPEPVAAVADHRFSQLIQSST